jgi:hypothetical protein
MVQMRIHNVLAQQLVEVVAVLEEVLEAVERVVEKQPRIQAVKLQLHQKVEGSQQLFQKKPDEIGPCWREDERCDRGP